MKTEKTQNVEVVSDNDVQLVKYAEKTGLEKTATSALVDAFRPIFAKARTAIDDAKGVAESVKDATCVKEIKKSRACRLALRAIRIESDSVRKKQKEHALLYGRAVDGFHNILLADLSPVENALQDAEDIAERAEAARLAQLKADREKELQPFMDAPIIGDLSALSEADYAKMLSDAKLLRQAKLDLIAKQEAEAKAKAEAERIERERIAAENARLKAEAEAREAAAKAEREEAAKKLAAEQAAAKAAQEAAEKKLAEERAAAEAAVKAAAEKARKEREAIEEKAKAERAAAEAIAAKEREARRKIEAENAAREAAAERERQAKIAAERAAAAAPDKEKLLALAASFRAISMPEMSTEAGKAAIMEITVWKEKLADRIKSQADELTSANGGLL